jgi:hypothetical protein
LQKWTLHKDVIQKQYVKTWGLKNNWAKFIRPVNPIDLFGIKSLFT